MKYQRPTSRRVFFSYPLFSFPLPKSCPISLWLSEDILMVYNHNKHILSNIIDYVMINPLVFSFLHKLLNRYSSSVGKWGKRTKNWRGFILFAFSRR